MKKVLANELKRSDRIVFDKSLEDGINPENLQLLKKYHRDMEMRELSVNSVYSYERDLLQWMTYLNKEQFNPNVKIVTEEDIEEFIYFCKQQGNNTERVKRRTASISAFYKFLRRKKEIKENPCEFISRPKKGLPVTVQTFLTPKQYELMKLKLSEQSNIQLQVYGIFSVDTMARVTACSSIRWEQIDFDEYIVNEVLEKEGYIVTLYFNEETKDLLLKLKQHREENEIDDKGYVFITKNDGEYGQTSTNAMSNWAKKIGELIGVPTLHCHDFRHSGSQLRKLAGMDLETISGLLNHSGLDVTKKFYLREDKKQIREKMAQYKI